MAIQKEKIQYFNNLRATACILVILTHSSMPNPNAAFGIFIAGFSLLSSPSSELFVTISSSLLAPTKLGMFEFYKKRFSKLIGPFLFWSLIVVAIDFIQGEINLYEAGTKMVLFPIEPVTGVYWFVYAICGLYLIIPIVSPWLESATKKMFYFILALWSLTLLLPYLNLILSKPIYSINGDYYFILNYLGGFVGFLFLGVFLRKFPLKFKKKGNTLLFLLALFLLGSVPVIFGVFYNREVLLISRENLSITSMLYVGGIFIFFQNYGLPSMIERLFNLIAKYSYGIYLIHLLVVRDIVWRIMENNRIYHPLIETPFITLVSLAICLILVIIIGKLPNSQNIIGA